MPGFVLLVRPRGDGDPAMRLGLTVSKKVGNAVVRNRVRRRLREIARQVIPEQARADLTSGHVISYEWGSEWVSQTGLFRPGFAQLNSSGQMRQYAPSAARTRTLPKALVAATAAGSRPVQPQDSRIVVSKERLPHECEKPQLLLRL